MNCLNVTQKSKNAMIEHLKKEVDFEEYFAPRIIQKYCVEKNPAFFIENLDRSIANDLFSIDYDLKRHRSAAKFTQRSYDESYSNQ